MSSVDYRLEKVIKDTCAENGVDNLGLEIDLFQRIRPMFVEVEKRLTRASREANTAKDQLEKRKKSAYERSIKRAGVRAGSADLYRWPEEVRDAVQLVCDLWHLTPPNSGKRANSPYAHWINGARDLAEACGELGPGLVLPSLRKDYEERMAANNGVAPFTVSGPGSLVKSARAHAGWMRERIKSGKEKSAVANEDGSYYG